jgi:hypothetical protein
MQPTEVLTVVCPPVEVLRMLRSGTLRKPEFFLWSFEVLLNLFFVDIGFSYCYYASFPYFTISRRLTSSTPRDILFSLRIWAPIS